MDSIVTKYTSFCAFCGKPTTTEHHLVFGISQRTLSEEDGLKIGICDKCHEFHKNNPIACKMSKMMGQLAYEKHEVAKGVSEEDAREKFRQRYGISYL